MNFRAMRSRAVASSIIVLSNAVLIGIVISIYSISVGLFHAIDDYASDDQLVIYADQAIREGNSNLSRDVALRLVDLPGIKKDSDGKPLASLEITSCTSFPRRSDNVAGFACFRGITTDLLKIRPNMKFKEGRTFMPGLREVVIGRQVQRQFVGMDVGGKVIMPDGPWTIVGVVEGGGIGEGLIYADSETMNAAFRRNSFNSVHVVTENAGSLDTIKTAITSDPTLHVKTERWRDYQRLASGDPINFFNAIAIALGTVIGLGVLFAALNMMYAAVAARTREIATLRAIGFSPGPVVTSVFVEALVLALLGAVIGVSVARIGFQGHDFVAGNITFRQDVSLMLALAGIGIALFIGVLGALFPAIRAARLPVATALQIR